MAINRRRDIKGGFWAADPKRVELLVELWADDTVTTREIGQRMGCSKNTVISKAHRLGLPPRRETPPRPAPRRHLIPATGECCYPIGHPGTADFHYCGAPAALGKSYCETHRALTVIATKPRKSKEASEDDAAELARQPLRW